MSDEPLPRFLSVSDTLGSVEGELGASFLPSISVNRNSSHSISPDKFRTNSKQSDDIYVPGEPYYKNDRFFVEDDFLDNSAFVKPHTPLEVHKVTYTCDDLIPYYKKVRKIYGMLEEEEVDEYDPRFMTRPHTIAEGEYVKDGEKPDDGDGQYHTPVAGTPAVTAPQTAPGTRPSSADKKVERLLKAVGAKAEDVAVSLASAANVASAVIEAIEDSGPMIVEPSKTAMSAIANKSESRKSRQTSFQASGMVTPELVAGSRSPVKSLQPSFQASGLVTPVLGVGSKSPSRGTPMRSSAQSRVGTRPGSAKGSPASSSRNGTASKGISRKPSHNVLKRDTSSKSILPHLSSAQSMNVSSNDLFEDTRQKGDSDEESAGKREPRDARKSGSKDQTVAVIVPKGQESDSDYIPDSSDDEQNLSKEMTPEPEDLETDEEKLMKLLKERSEMWEAEWTPLNSASPTARRPKPPKGKIPYFKYRDGKVIKEIHTPTMQKESCVTAHLGLKKDRKFFELNPPPVVSTVSPPKGGLEGNTRIEIRGERLCDPNRLDDVPKIYIGRKKCTDIMCISPNKVLCLTPPAVKLGPCPVLVKRNKRKSSIHLESVFNYEGPRIHHIKGNQGPAEGGNQVTIYGSSLGNDGSTQIFIDGALCFNVEVVIPGRKLVATVPSSDGASGEVDVEVMTSSKRFGRIISPQDGLTTKYYYGFAAIEESDPEDNIPPQLRKLAEDCHALTLSIDDLLKNSEETPERIYEVLKDQLPYIQRVFQYYCVEEGVAGDTTGDTMSMRQFRIFCDATKLLGRAMGQDLSLPDMDNVCVRVLRGVGDKPPGSVKVLSFTAFVNCLVRISHIKYKSVSLLSEKVDRVVCDHICEYANEIDDQTYFVEKFLDNRSKKVLRQYEPILRGLFQRYAAWDVSNMDAIHHRTTMNWAECFKMLEDYGVYSERAISVAESRRAFLYANLGQWAMCKCHCRAVCYCEKCRLAWEKEDRKAAREARRVSGVEDDTTGEATYEEFEEILARLALFWQQIKIADVYYMDDSDPIWVILEDFLKEFFLFKDVKLK